MGQITLKEIGGLGEHENTKSEYDNEVTCDLLCHKLKEIAHVIKTSEGKVCYVLGMGAHPKSTYKELKREQGVEVVWCGSILPKYFRIFSGVIASFAGLVKINDADKLPYVFLKLTKLSMAGIYFFDRYYEKSFVKAVIDNPLPREYDFTIKNDSGYFYYIVDADNVESSTGIYEIVSYGKDAIGVSKFL